MNFTNLLIEIADRIAVVTINRPAALNALNAEVFSDLKAAFIELEQNNDVACVILTGSGSKAFVAGADIAAMQAMDAVSGGNFARIGHAVCNLKTGRSGSSWP